MSWNRHFCILSPMDTFTLKYLLQTQTLSRLFFLVPQGISHLAISHGYYVTIETRASYHIWVGRGQFYRRHLEFSLKEQ